ncbi:hypothetical protein Esti_005888 [Eimeria stiedai]
MELQRPSVLSGQQTFSLCTPFSVKQQQLQLELDARVTHFKAQSLSYTTSGREDRKKSPPLELTEQEWESLTKRSQKSSSTRRLSHDEERNAKETARKSYRPSIQPAWLKHDRQTLRFFAFFQEPLSGSSTENSRRRYCVICYFLCDGTLSILECTTDNGSTRQGSLLKRHKVPRADGKGFVTLTDFVLGCDIELYKRVFRIVDCDEFTRWFCQNSGHEVGQAVSLPEDACFHAFVASQRGVFHPPQAVLDEIRAQRNYAEASLGKSCCNALLGQYLQNDRKVLSFSCYWKNPENFQCSTYYILRYFLSDDSVEVKVSPVKNSGYAPCATFLRRGRLPKKLEGVSWSDSNQSRSEFYLAEDFIVGKDIDVYGRSFHIYDCDAFTRQFYRDFLQIEQGQEIIQNERIVNEDTLQSCLRIVRGNQKHVSEAMSAFTKFLNSSLFKCNGAKRQHASVPHQPRVVDEHRAELMSRLKEDEGREFRISIRELNDKITVFECRKRNSGHAGGKFLEAKVLQNPKSGQKFSARDFFVGAEVDLNGYLFRITGADESTMKHMERHADKYPTASVSRVCAKVAKELDKIKATGALVTLDCLKQNLSGSLTEHELLTLTRAAAVPREPLAEEHVEAACSNYINVEHFVRICPHGFSRSELLLIARSFPKSEISGSPSQPVVFRLQHPACTALLSPTGMLFVMGGITKEQALWQAFRVAYKLKYRVWWKPIRQEGPVTPEYQRKAEYVCKDEVEFSPDSSSVLQLVCRVDLGGSFRPDVNAILEHPQLRGFSTDTKDGVAVRIPNIQEAQTGSTNAAETDEELAGELFAFDPDGMGGSRGRRASRAKGPTCLIFRTGKVLVLGCRSPDEINAAIDFVWPALVGLQ